MPGGNFITFPKDMDQAQKMFNMRIKIDVWSKGENESLRQGFRNQMAVCFWQLPARRVWLYLSIVRFLRFDGKAIAAGQKLDMSQLKLADQRGHAEDVIVEGQYYALKSSAHV